MSGPLSDAPSPANTLKRSPTTWSCWRRPRRPPAPITCSRSGYPTANSSPPTWPPRASPAACTIPLPCRINPRWPNLLRVLFDRPEVEVSWICDLDPSRLERFARRYPGVQVSSDLDRLLDDPALDAVLLATPVFTHYDLAWRCLEAGKHCFVEKPL